MEARRGQPEQLPNFEPFAYQRFATVGVRYLIPLEVKANPALSDDQLANELPSRAGNFRHGIFKKIPVFTIPPVNYYFDKGSLALSNHVIQQIKTLAKTKSSSFQEALPMITQSYQSQHAYRGTRIRQRDLIPQEPQVNKLLAIATYGLDYPPQLSRTVTKPLYISKGSLPEACSYTLPDPLFDDIAPNFRAIYSLILIYKGRGIKYISREESYAGSMKITDSETLRDKLQAVIFIPWK